MNKSVINCRDATESTGQLDTSKALAPAKKKARPKPETASLPEPSPAAVLQADKTTQSALSFKAITLSIVKRPSSLSPVTSGEESASAGCVKPLSSPGTKP